MLQTASWLFQLLPLSTALVGVWGPGGVAECPEGFLKVQTGVDPGGGGDLGHGSAAGGEAVTGAVTGGQGQGVDIRGQRVHVQQVVQRLHRLRHPHSRLLLRLWRPLEC